jgi:ABC-type nitrate/sulfonate/bicarbonate transport system substrate-binding protein
MVGNETTNSWNGSIPLVRRGGRDIKKMPRSLLIGAAGGQSPRKPDRAQPLTKVVAHTETWLVSDHPVCGAKVGFAEIFLMPQPPLLVRRGIRLAQAAAGVLLLWLAGCAHTAQPDSASTRTFKLGITSGAQEFVDFVMEGHGLLDQVGLKADKVKSLSPANLHLMVAERKVDIGFGGFTTMATARSEGKDIIVIYGVFSPVNMVFVRKDSPIKTLTDLKGKKLGVFGGPGSTTFAFLAVLAKNWYGIDLFRDAELVTAPAPALAELLGKGDIDAALLGTVESIQTFAQDRYRVLVDLSAEYKAHQGGRAPAHVTVATNEEFAKSHPDIVRDYLKAYKNALQYVRVHPEVWDEYAGSIKMDSAAERALLREKMGPNLVEQWDAEQIALQNDYLKLVHNIIGDSVLKVVPADLIRNDYTP